MGWKWKGALEGLAKGAMTGNPYVAVSGGAVGGFSQDIDKGLTGDSGSGMTQGLMSLGSGAYGGGDPSQAFSMFKRQRNPADQSDPMYDPLEHAGLIKSRYPFIPEKAFQSWLQDQGGIQMGAQIRR